MRVPEDSVPEEVHSSTASVTPIIDFTTSQPKITRTESSISSSVSSSTLPLSIPTYLYSTVTSQSESTPRKVEPTENYEDTVSRHYVTTPDSRLVEESATEILLTTADISAPKVTVAAVSQPRPFGFPRRNRLNQSSTTPVPELATESSRPKVSTATSRNFARSTTSVRTRSRSRSRPSNRVLIEDYSKEDVESEITRPTRRRGSNRYSPTTSSKAATTPRNRFKSSESPVVATTESARKRKRPSLRTTSEAHYVNDDETVIRIPADVNDRQSSRFSRRRSSADKDNDPQRKVASRRVSILSNSPDTPTLPTDDENGNDFIASILSSEKPTTVRTKLLIKVEDTIATNSDNDFFTNKPSTNWDNRERIPELIASNSANPYSTTINSLEDDIVTTRSNIEIKRTTTEPLVETATQQNFSEREDTVSSLLTSPIVVSETPSPHPRRRKVVRRLRPVPETTASHTESLKTNNSQEETIILRFTSPTSWIKDTETTASPSVETTIDSDYFTTQKNELITQANLDENNIVSDELTTDAKFSNFDETSDAPDFIYSTKKLTAKPDDTTGTNDYSTNIVESTTEPIVVYTIKPSRNKTESHHVRKQFIRRRPVPESTESYSDLTGIIVSLSDLNEKSSTTPIITTVDDERLSTNKELFETEKSSTSHSDENYSTIPYSETTFFDEATTVPTRRRNRIKLSRYDKTTAKVSGNVILNQEKDESEDSNSSHRQPRKFFKDSDKNSLGTNGTKEHSVKSRYHVQKQSTTTVPSVTETLIPNKKFDYAADALHRKYHTLRTTVLPNTSPSSKPSVTRLVTSVMESGTTERQRILIRRKYTSLKSGDYVPFAKLDTEDTTSSSRKTQYKFKSLNEILYSPTERNFERSTLPIEGEFLSNRNKFTTEKPGESSTIEIESVFDNIISSSKDFRK